MYWDTFEGYAVITQWDNEKLAVYLGWTDICCRDGLYITGSPTDEETKYWGWRRKKKARQADVGIPFYHCDLNEMRIIEEKFFKDGLWDKYLKNVKDLFKKVKRPNCIGGDPGMGLAGASCNLRCAAALLTVGEKFAKVGK